MTLARNPGVVTAVNAGPPATITIQLNGDTAADYPARYLDSYEPGVGDAVQVLSDGGYHVVLGRATLGNQRSVAQRTSSLTTITTAVDLVVLPDAIEVDGSQDVDLTWGWDSIGGSNAGDRIEFRPNASLNGGAFAPVGRMLIKVTVTSEAGGAGFTTHLAPAAGLWVYKLVGQISAGTGNFTLNAGSGAAGQAGPMTFTAQRKG